jgi:hypothetical protein
LSVVSVVCCQVEVSATDWSLVKRSPTDCGASFCVIKKPRTRGGYSLARGLQNTNPQLIGAPEEEKNILRACVCRPIHKYMGRDVNVVITQMESGFPAPVLRSNWPLATYALGSQMASGFSTACPLDCKVIDTNLYNLHPSLYQNLELRRAHVTDTVNQTNSFRLAGKPSEFWTKHLPSQFRNVTAFASFLPKRYYRILFSVYLLLQKFQYVLICLYAGLCTVLSARRAVLCVQFTWYYIWEDFA